MDLKQEAVDLFEKVKVARDDAGRGETGRKLAIFATKMEEAVAWAEHIEPDVSVYLEAMDTAVWEFLRADRGEFGEVVVEARGLERMSFPEGWTVVSWWATDDHQDVWWCPSGEAALRVLLREAPEMADFVAAMKPGEYATGGLNRAPEGASSSSPISVEWSSGEGCMKKDA